MFDDNNPASITQKKTESTGIGLSFEDCLGINRFFIGNDLVRAKNP